MGIRDRPWPFSKRDRPRKMKGEKRWVNLREAIYVCGDSRNGLAFV